MLILILSSIFANPHRPHTQKTYMDDYATQFHPKHSQQYKYTENGPIPLSAFLNDNDVRQALKKNGIDPNIRIISVEKKRPSSQAKTQPQPKTWMHTITDFFSTRSKDFLDWITSFLKKNTDVQSTPKTKKKHKQKAHNHGKTYF